MYAGENNGKFYTGCTDAGYWWLYQLSEKEQDWKQNETWFCPTATKPIYVENSSTPSPTLNIYNAWGIFNTRNGMASATMSYGGKTYAGNENGFNGSYSLNGYMLGIPSTGTFEGGVPAKNGFRNINDAKNTNYVPVQMDGLRFDTWPLESQAPAAQEAAAWSSNNMGRICINRHRGFTDVAFLDWSVRKVGLKELYTLQWHKAWNMNGPWTQAGGVDESSWPEWIRSMKEY